MKTACTTWKSAAWDVGEKIRFIEYKKPLMITDGVVDGYDCQDRLLVRYIPAMSSIRESTIGVIHVNLILPKCLKRSSV